MTEPEQSKNSVKIIPDKSKVYLVTGMAIAMGKESEVLIAGLLSDPPFEEDNELISSKNIVGTFAFTKRQAKFLRDHLNEFLGEQE